MSKLADDLERLCCAETEGKFFDCVTDSVSEIIRALRALEQIKTLVAGDRVPNWKDDWQTTHTRGLILDIIDGAVSLSRPNGETP